MLHDDINDNEPISYNSKKKSKKAAKSSNNIVDEKFEAMLESASKAPRKLKTSDSLRNDQRDVFDDGGRWTNENGDDDNDGQNFFSKQQLMIPENVRRVGEEIVGEEIPTIPVDDIDYEDSVDMNPKVADAPEFSIYQIASFQEIENEFSRDRASQYIDSKIDIGILYRNLHLNEEIDAENQKPWDWDTLFVEVQNSITNNTTET